MWKDKLVPIARNCISASLAVVLCVTGCAAQTPQSGREFYFNSLATIAATRTGTERSISPSFPFASVRIDGRCAGNVASRPPVAADGSAIPVQVSSEERYINEWFNYTLSSQINNVDYSSSPAVWREAYRGLNDSATLWQRLRCQRQQSPARVILPEGWPSRPREAPSSLWLSFHTSQAGFERAALWRPADFSVAYRSRNCTILERSVMVETNRYPRGGVFDGQRESQKDIIAFIRVPTNRSATIGSTTAPLAGNEMCGLRVAGIANDYLAFATMTDRQLLALVPPTEAGREVLPEIWPNVHVDRRLARLSFLLRQAELPLMHVAAGARHTASDLIGIMRANPIFGPGCSIFIERTMLVNDCEGAQQ
jgi:hypothetical protein